VGDPVHVEAGLIGDQHTLGLPALEDGRGLLVAVTRFAAPWENEADRVVGVGGLETGPRFGVDDVVGWGGQVTE
jgi:hypothetical protein